MASLMRLEGRILNLEKNVLRAYVVKAKEAYS